MKYNLQKTFVCSLLTILCAASAAHAGQANVYQHGSAKATLDTWGDTDTFLMQLGGGRVAVSNHSYHNQDFIFTGICPAGSQGSALNLDGNHTTRVIIAGCR